MDTLAEGKTKIIRSGDQPNELKVEFKDAATAFNGGKFAIIPGKGELNAKISARLFEQLQSQGIPTCYVSRGHASNELIYKQLQMIPLEVVVRNYAYGSACKRFDLVKGAPFKNPVVEYYLKSDQTGDPQITEPMILELGLLPDMASIQHIKRLALEINEIFVRYFLERGIRCADFKLEFGWDTQHSYKNRLLLGDELSPDNFRLRDINSGKVFDKDVFRLDLADLIETYQELLRRMESVSIRQIEPGRNRYHARIFVKSRKNILNPESKTILESLHHLGHSEISGLRAGKCFEITVETENLAKAEEKIRYLAENVLSNPVIEDYEFEL